jgi:spermidine synthase
VHSHVPAVVFVTALVTLALEVFYTRLFAALFWKDTAFAILSLAMLGIGASGILVYLKPGWFPESRTAERVALSGLAFGISIVVSYFGIVTLAETTDNMLAPIWGYGPLIAVGLIPFFCGGTVLSIIFAHRAQDIARLYLFDLVGAAIGATITLPLVAALNGPAIVPLLALVTLLTFGIFARRHGARLLSRGAALAGAGVAAIGALHATQDVLRITHSHGKLESDVTHERWDPLARVTVHERPPAWAWFTIDSRVITPILRWDGDPGSVDYLKKNVLQLAYHLGPYDDVVIIGPGGGSDVLSAVVFGNERITGVEVNRSIIGLVRNELSGHAGGLYDHPAVTIAIADGRAYVAGMDRKVDLIQATFIDTVTAANSGAHTLSENYLYTTDAAHDFLDHLTDDGVLSMARWGGIAWGWAETHREVAIVARALRERGSPQPGHHVVLVRGPSPEKLTRGLGYQNQGGDMESMTAMLIRPRPFTDAQLETLARISDGSGFVTLWAGRHQGADPTLAALLAPEEPHAFYDLYEAQTGLDISPVSDDRPFFFDTIRPIQALFREELPEWAQNPSYFAASVGVGVLSQLLVSTSVLVLLLILVPLATRFQDLRDVRRPVSTLGFFVCLGLGYIGIEISMMQRFALLLEHPVYALVVVLGSMLLFSGLGSLSTSRITRDHASAGARRAALLVGVLAAYGLLLPAVTRPLMGWAFALKVLVALLLAFPPAFLMGMLFPIGVAVIRESTPRLVPWVWGLNSSFSVLGAILSLYIAMSFGHTATWYAFTAVYLGGFAGLLRMRGHQAYLTMKASV